MRKKIVLAIFIGSLLISGCGQKELSPQDIELVNNLKSELSQVKMTYQNLNLSRICILAG